MSKEEYDLFGKRKTSSLSDWWKDLRFRLWGETNGLMWLIYGAVILQIALYVTIAWVAIHFISKYW